jgi:hypothetical protein
MAQLRLELSVKEEKSLITVIELVTSRIDRTHVVANERIINGRLSTSFQSQIFSPSGSHVIYMPRGRPNANGHDK